MSGFVILPHKPKFREPCNGCGQCCRLTTCETGVQFLNVEEESPCPVLEFDGAIYRCGLIANPVTHLGLPRWAQEHELSGYLSKSFTILIGSGQGCGMED